MTWARISPENIYFEKKQAYPPWSLNTKVTLILPLKSLEENLKDLETLIFDILSDRIEQAKEKVTLPIRMQEI